MKIKIKNQWLLEFNIARQYLNLVDKATSRPIVNPGRDLAYAIARTAKKVQGDFDLLADKEKEKDNKNKEVEAKIAANGCDTAALRAELDDYNKTWVDDWKALIAKEIEIEVHGFRLSDVPKDFSLPQNLWDTLSELVIE